jgi:putative transposase
VSTRASLGRRWRAEEVAAVAVIARVLRVSRQALDDTLIRPVGPRPPRRRSAPPPLLEGWEQLELSRLTCTPEEALDVLARRHPAAGYRKICARPRRVGFVVNKKKVARLLREWDLSPSSPPAPQGTGAALRGDRPDRVVADRHDQRLVRRGRLGLLQRGARLLRPLDLRMDVHAALSREGSLATTRTGMGDSVASRRGRADRRGVPPRQRHAVHLVALPRRRHRSRDQTVAHRVPPPRRQRVHRTALPNPQGGMRPPNDFASFDEALTAITTWVDDYNHHRPHDSLHDETPAEASSGRDHTQSSSLTVNQPGGRYGRAQGSVGSPQ